MHSTRSASDKVYQLLAHDRWFSPDTPASSTTNTGCHDIAEILLKMALSTIKHNKINQSIALDCPFLIAPSMFSKVYSLLKLIISHWKQRD